MSDKCGVTLDYKPWDPETGGRKTLRIETCGLSPDHTGYHEGGFGPFGPWVGPDLIVPTTPVSSKDEVSP